MAGGLLAAAFMALALLAARRVAAARDEAEEGLRMANASLQQLSRLQQAILDGAALSVISTAPDGRITTFSRGAEQMLGYRRDEMVGRQTPAILAASCIQARLEKRHDGHRCHLRRRS